MKRPTLGEAFLGALVVLAILLGLLMSSLLSQSRLTVVRSARTLMDVQSHRIGERVAAHLARAEAAARDLERVLLLGTCPPADAACLEGALFSEVSNHETLAEAAFTGAGSGSSSRGSSAPFQLSVYRESSEAGSPILTRWVHGGPGGFAAELRRRAPGGGRFGPPFVRLSGPSPPDPTRHPTFTGAVASGPGALVWSDLSYSELDSGLPEAQQRVVVTVLAPVGDGRGGVLGVFRVALLALQLDADLREIEAEVRRIGGGDFRTFLCDGRGGLVTRVRDTDRLRDVDSDLRADPAGAPPEVAAALAQPSLARLSPENPGADGSLEVGGRSFLLTFRLLEKTQGWIVGIVTAEDSLPGIADLKGAGRRLLAQASVLVGLILLGGAVSLRAVRRGLGGVVEQTARMRDFDFAPAEARSQFRDILSVMEGLETAKTALRAMGKYVPVDLVRLLYRTGREPVLGGSPTEISMMFTDIKDFTTLSEHLPPNELAEVLGLYLEAMTRAIYASEGTIDKYIGDAIMAVWNTPSPCPGHPVKACAAALACARAGDELFRSASWKGRPPFTTRVGLHRGEVLVGHFGSPDRMSFTALGDGVNLASRLEGLNKEYGTTTLVSETIWQEARDAFSFRRLDRVAVKGKTRGIVVYELLGEARLAGPRLDAARRYEAALERYWARDFRGCSDLLADLADDPPSVVLLARARRWLADPPPPDWDGVFVAQSK